MSDSRGAVDVPLFDLSTDLMNFLPDIEPDLDAFHEIVRSDWSLDEVVLFSYLTAVSDYNKMLLRLLDDPDVQFAQVRELAVIVRKALGRRFRVAHPSYSR